jgi:hypothetical protein
MPSLGFGEGLPGAGGAFGGTDGFGLFLSLVIEGNGRG